MNIDSGWAMFALTGLGFLGTIIAALWRFSKSVDRLSLATDQVTRVVEAQWKKIDAHGEALDDHQNRLVEVETTLKFIPGAVPR